MLKRIYSGTDNIMGVETDRIYTNTSGSSTGTFTGEQAVVTVTFSKKVVANGDMELRALIIAWKAGGNSATSYVRLNGEQSESLSVASTGSGATTTECNAVMPVKLLTEQTLIFYVNNVASGAARVDTITIDGKFVVTG